MKSTSTSLLQNNSFSKITRPSLSQTVRLGFGACALAIAFLSTGCNGPLSDAPVAQNQKKPGVEQKVDSLTLREGDVLRISFPSAANMDTSQTIRRDGKIALALIGEVQAAGLKPSELQDELIKLYAPQLVSKEILVSVVSSSIPAFITGAVLRPGKIVSDHPITALEAIMEAGGPDYTKANLKAVVVIRQEADGKTRNITLNLKLVIDGKTNEPFYLKPADIVYVPEGFSLF